MIKYNFFRKNVIQKIRACCAKNEKKGDCANSIHRISPYFIIYRIIYWEYYFQIRLTAKKSRPCSNLATVSQKSKGWNRRTPYSNVPKYHFSGAVGVPAFFFLLLTKKKKTMRKNLNMCLLTHLLAPWVLCVVFSYRGWRHGSDRIEKLGNRKNFVAEWRACV